MNKKRKQNKITQDLKIKIRNDFVQGIQTDNAYSFPTLDDLITKYNVAQSSIYRIARQEQWKVERDNFQTKYKEKLDRERAKTLSTKSKQFDDKSLNVADAIYITVAQVLQNNNLDVSAGKKGLTPTQINGLATATFTAQKIAKLALGEATQNIDATINDNYDSFRKAMELLDELEESRSTSGGVTH
tara:strand:- start:1251 stop:1811 length:561 start_codon:yes stop_codon:yes gene_type:complete